MKVWWDFSLVNLANRRNLPNLNLPISYFYIGHYWLFSKFTKFSSSKLFRKVTHQTKVPPNFVIYNMAFETCLHFEHLTLNSFPAKLIILVQLCGGQPRNFWMGKKYKNSSVTQSDILWFHGHACSKVHDNIDTHYASQSILSNIKV